MAPTAEKGYPVAWDVACRPDTKIHALIDANGLPVALKLTAGQAHDRPSAVDMLGNRSDGDVLLADRAYDSDALGIEMAARGVWVTFKPMP